MKTCEDFYVVEKVSGRGTTTYYIKERWKLFWLIPVWTYFRMYDRSYDIKIRWESDSLESVKERIHNCIEFSKMRSIVKTTKYSSCKLFE